MTMPRLLLPTAYLLEVSRFLSPVLSQRKSPAIRAGQVTRGVVPDGAGDKMLYADTALGVQSRLLRRRPIDYFIGCERRARGAEERMAAARRRDLAGLLQSDEENVIIGDSTYCAGGGMSETPGRTPTPFKFFW
jgi:hypothetical protein